MEKSRNVIRNHCLNSVLFAFQLGISSIVTVADFERDFIRLFESYGEKYTQEDEKWLINVLNDWNKHTK